MFGKMKFIVAGLSLASIVMVAPQVRADEAPPEKKPAKKDGGPREGGPKGDRAKMIQDELAKLNLTDDQKKKTDPILEKFKDDSHKIMSDDSIKPEDKRPKMAELFKGLIADINAVLTPEQQAQFKKDQDERKAKRDAEGGPKRGGDKGPKKEGGDKGPKHEGGDKGPPPAPAN